MLVAEVSRPAGRRPPPPLGHRAALLFRLLLLPLGLPLGLLLVLPALALVGGCGPSSAKVQAWKGQGPEGVKQLVAVVSDPGQAAGLRGEAAAALVEAGAADDLQAAMAGLDLEARNSLAPAAVPRLAPLLQGSDRERAGDARAVLFALREQTASVEARRAAEAALFPALLADLRAGRERAGRLGVKDMLVGIGAPIVPSLVPLLSDAAVPFGPLVEVLDKVADPEAKDKAGAALVARARALPELPEPIYPALATLGGQPAADFLMELVEKPDATVAERAATALAGLRRAKGVSAFAARKAGTPTTSAPLREKLFLVTEEDKSAEAREALLGLVRTNLDGQLRLRAFRALLKSAGGAGVLPGLEAFPASATLSLSDFQEQVVAPISAMPGFDTRPPLFKAFQSPSALARLTAVLVIERMGFASDSEHIGKLSQDKGTVKGLPPAYQVGRQATRAVAALKAKAAASK